MSKPGITAERATTVPAGSESAPAAVSGARSHVAFRVSNLVTGRRLKFPLVDQNGMLLLAANSVVTPHFKELLLARGVCDIMLNPADVDGMGAESRHRGQPVGVSFDSSLADLLHGMADAGRLFTHDTGPRFKDRLVQHGCKAFKTWQQESLVRKHTESCSRLDRMVQSAVRGETVSAEEIGEMVSDYLVQLQLDSDCMLDLMARTRAYSGMAQHCLQMSVLGMIMAIHAGMSDVEVRLVGVCGLVHDWGMAYVPDSIRNAERVLTQVEFLEIKKHPIYTLELLRKVNAIPSQVPLICYQVHERPNGTGYPRGRHGSNIHPCARILNVADAYVALVSPRPYRKPLEPYAALEFLIRQAAKQMVDPVAVRSLLSIMSQFPIGSNVLLSDGRKARVIRRNGEKYSSPIVQILEEADGAPADPLAEPTVIDPSEQQLTITTVLTTEGHEDIDASRVTALTDRG